MPKPHTLCHKGIPGNEAAELVNPTATATDTPPRKPSSDAQSPIPVKQAPNGHRARKFILEGRLHHHAQKGNAVLLALLRSGHTPLLKAYAHLLDPADDPTCPLCKEESQTLEHWLQRCQTLDVLRKHTFGSPSPPFGVRTADPEKLLALDWAIFYSPKHRPYQQHRPLSAKG